MLILMKFDGKYAQVIIFPIVCSVILINSQFTSNIRPGQAYLRTYHKQIGRTKQNKNKQIQFQDIYIYKQNNIGSKINTIILSLPHIPHIAT